MTDEELIAYLAALPVEDEVLSDDEIAAIEAGRAALARGDVVTADEIAAIVAGA